LILSHRHRFIYIKTRKTASSSVEVVLIDSCGPEDVITPPWEQARNYRLSHPLVPKRPLMKRLLFKPVKWSSPSLGFFAHIPAWRVRAYIGEEVWNSYFKFTFERNPWDRQVSDYLYWTKRRTRRGKGAVTFDQYLRKKATKLDNYDLYAMNGEVVVDFIGRYESLALDLARALRQVGLAVPASLPHLNSSNRMNRDYRSFYSDYTRRLVADWYKREIDLFGYEF
jgi:hypothetical protein